MTELYRLLHASAHDIPLPDGSVQMICTSPPYLGLREYEGDQEIDWLEVVYRLNEWTEPVTVPAMRCALGLEPSPVAYIGHLILCLREWRRILRDDGVAFVNLGDSYNGTGYGQKTSSPDKEYQYQNTPHSGKSTDGLKPKDLCGIPWLFALAARADGWWLRSDIIWAKPNPMPESVTDRPTSAHEHVFLLAKSARYYYDADAVREAATYEGDTRHLRADVSKLDGNPRADNGSRERTGTPTHGRNLRNVWHIATQPTPYAHFATYPERLVEPCIRAGTSARGCCPECGAPWERVVERTSMVVKPGPSRDERSQNGQLRTQVNGTMLEPPTSTTTGWRPTCECAGLPKLPTYPVPSVAEMRKNKEPSPEYVAACAEVTQRRSELLALYSQVETAPCIVLDPFNGSGTTGKKAIEEGRAYVGVDISKEYLYGVTSERTSGGLQIGMGL